jgi:hypothetical protein
MRRAHCVALFVVLALATARDQQQGRFDVSRFGAVGDGKAIDTDAINKAIDAAKTAGGGTVVFHHGTFLAGSIHLASHVALFIDRGATIESAPPAAAPCDPPEPNQWDLEDVAIYGTGVIRGTNLSRSANANSPAGTGNKAIALQNSRIHYEGGGTKADADLEPEEKEKDYPEPDMFGRMSSYALFARHVDGLDVRDADFTFDTPEQRPVMQLRDVTRVNVEHLRAQKPGTIERVLYPVLQRARVLKEAF